VLTGRLHAYAHAYVCAVVN